MALNSGIKTNQILTNDDEVCIPSLSSILLAVLGANSFICSTKVLEIRYILMDCHLVDIFAISKKLLEKPALEALTLNQQLFPI